MIMKRCLCERGNERRYHNVREAGAKVGAHVEIRGTDNPFFVSLWRIIEVNDLQIENNTNES